MDKDLEIFKNNVESIKTLIDMGLATSVVDGKRTIDIYLDSLIKMYEAKLK